MHEFLMRLDSGQLFLITSCIFIIVAAGQYFYKRFTDGELVVEHYPYGNKYIATRNGFVLNLKTLQLQRVITDSCTHYYPTYVELCINLYKNNKLPNILISGANNSAQGWSVKTDHGFFLDLMEYHTSGKVVWSCDPPMFFTTMDNAKSIVDRLGEYDAIN